MPDGGMAPALLAVSPSRRLAVQWHLLIDATGRPGADNMAIDQALLEDVAERDDGVAFLRLYRWNPPCLSFGRNEPALARYDRAAIERLGLYVVRRPTGGRAVWHQHEVTYALAAPVAAFGSLQASYVAIHQRLARALRLLGAPAELARRTGRAPGPSAGPCFAWPVGGEVAVEGRKVIGSAQVRDGRAFLQHGSILLAGSQEIVNRVGRKPSAPPEATSLSAALDRMVTFQEVTQAIRETWLDEAEAWTQVSSAVPPSPPHAVFWDPAWTWRR